MSIETDGLRYLAVTTAFGARSGALREAADEIDRLRADNDRLRANIDAEVDRRLDEEAPLALQQASHEIGRLRALLTEARKWMVAPCGAAETSDLLFRIDVALGGGAPCATCNGTGPRYVVVAVGVAS